MAHEYDGDITLRPHRLAVNAGCHFHTAANVGNRLYECVYIEIFAIGLLPQYLVLVA